MGNRARRLLAVNLLVRLVQLEAGEAAVAASLLAVSLLVQLAQLEAEEAANRPLMLWLGNRLVHTKRSRSRSCKNGPSRSHPRSWV